MRADRFRLVSILVNKAANLASVLILVLGEKGRVSIPKVPKNSPDTSPKQPTRLSYHDFRIVVILSVMGGNEVIPVLASRHHYLSVGFRSVVRSQYRLASARVAEGVLPHTRTAM